MLLNLILGVRRLKIELDVGPSVVLSDVGADAALDAKG
jgi:hypothetical protein